MEMKGEVRLLNLICVIAAIVFLAFAVLNAFVLRRLFLDGQPVHHRGLSGYGPDVCRQPAVVFEVGRKTAYSFYEAFSSARRTRQRVLLPSHRRHRRCWMLVAAPSRPM